MAIGERIHFFRILRGMTQKYLGTVPYVACNSSGDPIASGKLCLGIVSAMEDFSDITSSTWCYKYVLELSDADVIDGYSDGTFKPDQNITRAEAMTLINRVLERKPESPADLLTNMNKWTDNMDTSKWYYLDVQEATNSHGYTRKTFNYELWRQMLPDPDWSRYER